MIAPPVLNTGLPSLKRKPLYAPRGVVATSQPLAAQSGLAAFRAGGTAVDAALAAAITLTVVQPCSNAIGSDLFALVWDGRSLHALNASGRSPASLREGTAIPVHGWLPVTVPGAPAGWQDLHARFGRLPYSSLFADAIGYARNGHPVSPTVAEQWRRSVALHSSLKGPSFAEWARVFAPGGRGPSAGQLWSNPDLARSLESIAAGDFYTGPLAEAITVCAARSGGLLTSQDLARHTNEWVAPISAGYKGHEVWVPPPNGQGVVTLLALRVLDGMHAHGLHEQIEALKIAFAEAFTHVADPDFVGQSPLGLLSGEHVDSLRSRIGPDAAVPIPRRPAEGGTVYIATADEGGMMVSLMQSNCHGFGSHIVVPGTGFTLQNRGIGFTAEATHRNAAAGRKRARSTIIPAFLTCSGEPVGLLGIVGGHMQPQGQLQLLLGLVDGALDPQAALDAPRFYWRRDRDVLLEPGLVDDASHLRARGHNVAVADDLMPFGVGYIVQRAPGGGYVAGADPRWDGVALGW